MAYPVSMPDPLMKSRSKALESVQFDTDFGGYVVTREGAVPHQSVRPLSTHEEGYLSDPCKREYPGVVIEERVSNERNSNESRLQIRSYPTQEGVATFPTKLERSVDRSALARFADSVKQSQTFVSRGAALPVLDTKTVSVSQTLYAPELDRRIITEADAFQDRVDVVTDPDTGLMEKVVSEVVFELPTLSEQVAGRNTSYKEVATGVWIKETRLALKSDGTEVDPNSNAAIWTRSWETDDEFNFPSYQLPLLAELFPTTFLPQQRRTVCRFKLPVRLGFRGLTQVRYTETLHAAQPSRPAAILDLNGRDWTQDGVLVNFNVKNVLMDDPNGAFYDVTTLAGDTFYGNYTERVAGTQATPVTGSIYHLALLNAGQPSSAYWRVEAKITPAANKMFRMLLKEVKLK
jgi:hypothetical protein